MSEKPYYHFNKDDEGYTTAEDVQYFIDNANIPKDKVIGCPFDLDNSHFVQVFKNNGYKVINTHIAYGEDFYKENPKNGDIIVSNPPFANKAKLLERLLSFGKDTKFALIFGIQCFNSEKFCNILGKFNKPQYVHLQRRMRFTKDHINYDFNKLERPSFASMGVCNNLFEKDIQVGEGKR